MISHLGLHKKIGLAAFFILSLFSSCKKLIEIPANPSNQLPVSTVFADSSDILAAMAGVYADFGTLNSLTFGSGQITVLTGLTSDELQTSNSEFGTLPFYSNSIQTNDNTVQTIWADAYRTLFQVNICLEGISSTTVISNDLKRQLIGELKTVRAFYYFNLINIWGAVPYLTGTDYKYNQKAPRTSADSIYGFIESDLSDAEKGLTADYPSEGRARPNLYVAKALLSRVYLYQGKYQDAANEASDVINSGLYSLEQNLNDVFLNGSQESLWQLPAAGFYQATPEAGYFVPFDSTLVPYGYLTTTLLNSFEPGDERRTYWTAYNAISDGTSITDYYYPFKYKNSRPDQTPVEDYMILRLAEVYLIRAEALAQTGNVDDALADINTIRRRAGLNVSTASTQSEITDAVLQERQTELFCEWGNRWFDLKRTGLIDSVLSVEKPGWQPADALFPIPLVEIQSNPFLKQNPGY